MRVNVFRWVVPMVLVAVNCAAQPGGNQVGVVQEVKAALQGSGVDFGHGPGECGRFEITKRVAWTLHQRGDSQVGLIAKFGAQNGCSADNTTSEPKYGVDILMWPDGTIVDILGGSGGDPNTPQWNVGHADPSLYRPAFDPGGSLGVVTPPPSGGTQPPPVDLQPLVDRISRLEAEVGQLQTALTVAQQQFAADQAGIQQALSRISVLESKPIPNGCKAAIKGLLNLSCSLTY